MKIRCGYTIGIDIDQGFVTNRIKNSHEEEKLDVPSD